MAQASECKQLGHYEPEIGVHSSISQDVKFGEGFMNFHELFSMSSIENYTRRKLVTCPEQRTYTSSIKLITLPPCTETCTTKFTSTESITTQSYNAIDFREKFNDTNVNNIEDQVHHSLLENSTNVILASNYLFKNSKPLEGEPLEILNKTFKRLFKQTPARL